MKHLDFKEVLHKNYINILKMVKKALNWYGRAFLLFNPWVRKIPWRNKWQSSLVFLPGPFHGQRSLKGYSLKDGRGGCD